MGGDRSGRSGTATVLTVCAALWVVAAVSIGNGLWDDPLVPHGLTVLAVLVCLLGGTVTFGFAAVVRELARDRR